MFAIDKLGICNNALLATGNQPVTIIADGSDEWTFVSAAYDRALPKVLVAHDWKFALNFAEMTHIGQSTYPGFQDIYALPPDCLLLPVACDDRDIALIQPVDARAISEEGINIPPMDYRILNGQLHCIAPSGAHALYVQNPAATNTSGFTVGFSEALTTEIEALITRGYNEDVEATPGAIALAKTALTDARQQDSSVEPRRIIFRSRMLEQRRRRRNFGFGIW